jgi:hypothetical protein
MYRILAIVLFMVTSFSVSAEQFKQHNDYRIHYNAINTTVLPSQVAELHKITRSKNRALLNIAVRHHHAEGDNAVAAQVKVSAVNLAQQYREIEMREVRETEAVYYIGVFTFTEGETFEFNLEITPEGENEPYLFKFTQQFFF